jgi:hypothetical protein
MERIRDWLFPIAVALTWLGTTAHVLARLGEAHATVAAQQQRQEPATEQPASDTPALARR